MMLAYKKINSLLYADDIVLISSSAVQLKEMLDTCERHSQKNGYKFSPVKCEIITPHGEGGDIFKLCGQEIKIVESSKYLGLPVTSKGLDIGGIRSEGIVMALKSAVMFRSLGCNSSGLSPVTIKRILVSFVRPQMVYGLGLTFLGKGLENALDKTWHKIW